MFRKSTMLILNRDFFLCFLMKFLIETDASSTGRWKILFISKDGSNIEPYSLLMLNQSDSKTSFCSSDYQLYDEIQIDHCVTTDLINWHRNPPDKVAVTYTNQYGELLNFKVYDNSEVKLNSRSRENWFNTSYLIESKYSNNPTSVLKSTKRNFVNSYEGSYVFTLNSMSVSAGFTNYTKSKWYHLTTVYYPTYISEQDVTRCYKDTNNNLGLPVTNCESSHNCVICCSLLKKKMLFLHFEVREGPHLWVTNGTCYCVDELPKVVADQFADDETSCDANCADPSQGLCYNIYEISGMIFSHDVAYDVTEDKMALYNVKTQVTKTEIKIWYTKIPTLLQAVFHGVTLETSSFCPEWILQYSTTAKDLITDHPSEYSRIIESWFSRDENNKLYTRLDFGPIDSKEFTLKSLCGMDFSRNVKITKFHLQKTTPRFQDNYEYGSSGFHYKSLIHSPYLIVKGYWYDKETLEPMTQAPITSSAVTEISSSNVNDTKEECVATEAYSVEQNGQSFQCKCFPEPNVTMSAKLVEDIQDAVRTNLSVKTNALSSTTRTKISAQDDRSSSKTIGLLGSILLCLEFALIVFLDSTYLIQSIHNLYNKIKQRHIAHNEAIR